MTLTKAVRLSAVFLAVFLLFGSISLALGMTASPAQGSSLDAAPASSANGPRMDNELTTPEVPNAPCSGGPTIDGVLLDECFDETFTVGGTTKTIRVWYTNNVSTVQRTVDGTTYNLTHWVNNDTEPQDVAQWGREAWERWKVGDLSVLFPKGAYRPAMPLVALCL